jgi:hypothetical protein
VTVQREFGSTRPPRSQSQPCKPRRHHLDRRADQIAQQGDGDPNDLLSTMQVAMDRRLNACSNPMAMAARSSRLKCW